MTAKSAGTRVPQVKWGDDVLSTEADVELKMIVPFLTGANYLEIPARSLKAKAYLAPTALDKVAGKQKGYYPDFSVWHKALPVLVCEAKSPEVEVEVGYREAQLYARHLNQEYQHNTNPCRFVIACNGRRLLAGNWDAAPEINIDAAELYVGSSATERLRAFCHHRLIATYADEILARIRSRVAIRPFSRAGGQPLLNSKKPFNTFAAELAPVLRRYFTSSTQNNDPEIFEKGYVASEDITEYDRILESLLKDRIATRSGNLVEDLAPSKSKEPRLSGAIDRFRHNERREGQLQLITGGVGTGKSLFARRYKELLQPEGDASHTFWSFIDFNLAPVTLEGAEQWLCEKFIESFIEENPSFNPFTEDNLNRVFSRDLQRRKGVYNQLAKISEQDAARQRIQDITNWQDDPQHLAFGVCNHILGERAETIVVVMDNVDRLSLNNQLSAFQLSLWFMDKTRAFIILQMRDETYERFKDRPPLDTFRSGVIFHISPPRFLDVVKRRLELSLEYLAKNTDKRLEYKLSNGVTIVYPNSRLGEFIKGIYLELFERRTNISRVLQGIAGRDVRRALEMFVSIINSGHLSEEAITSNARGGGEIAITEYVVLRILMRTEYRFFSNRSGFISNIFDFDEDWEQPNNFLLSDILFWLSDNRKKNGEIGLEGYFSVQHIADILQLRGYVEQDVVAACSMLVQRHLIEADHMNSVSATLDDCVKVTASGYIHLRILCERLEYLYGVLTVTPISDSVAASKIADTINVEGQSNFVVSSSRKAGCVRAFRDYLKERFRVLSAAYPQFGAERSGAAFVLRKIDSALAYFYDPSRNQNIQRDFLDD